MSGLAGEWVYLLIYTLADDKVRLLDASTVSDKHDLDVSGNFRCIDRAGLILSGLYHGAKNILLTASLMSAAELSNRGRLKLVWLLAIDHVASGEYSCTSKLLDCGKTVAQLASGAMLGLRKLYSSFCSSSQAEGKDKDGDPAASRESMVEDKSATAPSDVEDTPLEKPDDNNTGEEPVGTDLGPHTEKPPLVIT